MLLLPHSVWGFESHAALPNAPAPTNSAGRQGRSLCLTQIHEYTLSFNPSAVPGQRKLVIYDRAHNEALSSVWLSSRAPSISTHKFFLFPFKRQRAVTFYSDMKGATGSAGEKPEAPFLHLSSSWGWRGKLGCLCRREGTGRGRSGPGVGAQDRGGGRPTHIPEHRHDHRALLA